MSLEESTFNTAQVLDNEIVKASDFTFAFDNLINNVSRMTQMVLEANQDFVINGKVIPYQGMNVKISPIYGVCFSTGQNFGSTEEQVMEYGFGESTEGRIDIIQVKGEWATYDNQQRAFNDPDTDTQTYQYVDTKKFLKPVFQIKTGEEGSSVAPEVDDGWVKLAEVVIRANNSTILESDIKNITSDVAGLDNDSWTTQPSITYNIGYISDVNKRFREQHNEDGSHKEKVIGTKEMNIGTGANALNSNVIPLGGSVTLPNETISITDSVLSMLVKVSTLLTTLFNNYLKNGAFNFNGEVALSSIADVNNILTNALKLGADGEGAAYLKIGDNTVLTITPEGKLVTNGYSATASNQLITKAVTDSISNLVNNLASRVQYLEQNLDPTAATNRILSKFSVNQTTIKAATTQNVSLQGEQFIDGVSCTSGDFVLVKNQNDQKENGIYQITASSWVRAAFDMAKQFFSVINGNTNKGCVFYSLVDNIIVGETDIIFLQSYISPSTNKNTLVLRDKNGVVHGAKPTNKPTAPSDEIPNMKFLADVLYPVGFVYPQYPLCPSPIDMNLYGDWEDISNRYTGLFTRIAGGAAEEFNKQLEVLSSSGTTLTFADGHNLTVGSLLIDCLGENPTYEQRDVLSVNGNTVTISAAFSSTLTNVLIGQMDQLQNHTHFLRYRQAYDSGNANNAFATAGSNSSTYGMDSGRSGEETRVKNVSVRLWQRIS